jgi:hypothetical protein
VVTYACSFKVGQLCEMPPTDFMDDRREVTCLLGLNVNGGQEIKLRLRTNDMLGFRNYQRIRETLVHELVHNVWADHDINFKTLNSQLLRECASINAAHSSACSVLGGAHEVRCRVEPVLFIFAVRCVSLLSLVQGATLHRKYKQTPVRSVEAVTHAATSADQIADWYPKLCSPSQVAVAPFETALGDTVGNSSLNQIRPQAGCG